MQRKKFVDIDDSRLHGHRPEKRFRIVSGMAYSGEPIA
jgi:hypothetical protein